MEAWTQKDWFNFYSGKSEEDLVEMARTAYVDISGAPLYTFPNHFGGPTLKPHVVVRLCQSRGFTPSKKQLQEMVATERAERRREQVARTRANRERAAAAESEAAEEEKVDGKVALNRRSA